jgi:quercetin 2,3-dioxygenase
MLQVLPIGATSFVGGGPFRIRPIRPGLTEGGRVADPVIGPLSRVDHAFLDVGAVVSMHQHRNDEILSYMWRGLMVHEDSTGQRVELTPSRLMMMNAGRGFSHEESTPSVPVEMLQIFIRPQAADLAPSVQFHDRQSIPRSEWTHLGGPIGSGAPLTIRNEVNVYDAHLKAGDRIAAPSRQGWRQWLYVMHGTVEVGRQLLEQGDAVADSVADLPALRAASDTTLVAFLIDPAAPVSLAGTISGRR